MKKSYSWKPALTMAEMCIVLVIISAIAYYAIITIKPYDKTLKYLYSRTFHSIETAIYNALITDIAEFPDTPKKMCEALLTYLNASKISCNNTGVSLDAKSFPDSALQFVATNSMKFFISQKLTYNKTLNEGKSTQEDVSFPYFIVFVDMTGERKPNSAEWHTDKRRTPDIVAFAVSETGVAPVGPPVLDMRYIPAKIEYPPTMEKTVDNFSSRMTYYEAKKKAWGGLEESSVMHTLDFNDEIPNESLLKVVYPAAPAVDTANGCSDEHADCMLIIDAYN